MDSPIIQLLVLAGIAIFLILKLKGVLGTRDGFEAPAQPQKPVSNGSVNMRVIEGGADPDITDHVPDGSPEAKALAAMKRIEPSFGVNDFLQGAKGAYEMILMGFERGELAEIKPFLSDEVYQTFAEVVEAREREGLTIEADFAGVRETSLADARFDPGESRAEVTVRFVGELSSVVRDRAGEIIEGKPGQYKKQKDSWTFERIMGSDDPNWQLVATSE